MSAYSTTLKKAMELPQKWENRSTEAATKEIQEVAIICLNAPLDPVVALELGLEPLADPVAEPEEAVLFASGVVTTKLSSQKKKVSSELSSVVLRVGDSPLMDTFMLCSTVGSRFD